MRIAADTASRRSSQSICLRPDVAWRTLVSVLRIFGLHSDPVHCHDCCRLATISLKRWEERRQIPVMVLGSARTSVCCEII